MVKQKVLFFFLLTLMSHIFLLFIRDYMLKANDAFQQEHFTAYVSSLRLGEFPKGLQHEDTRFFPGLPILIYLFDLLFNNITISNLILGFTILSLIFFISYTISKNAFYSFWLTIFPPIVFEQTSKISTEGPVIAGFLGVYLLFKKQKYLFASFLAGFAIFIRPISICIYLALLIFLLIHRKWRTFFISSFILFLFLATLAVSNLVIWKDIFYQFRLLEGFGRATFVPLQLLKDIIRAFEWQQFKILISGILYILFSFFLLFSILQKKGSFLVKGDNLFIKIFSILTFLFIYSIGPTPFLEEARRYLAVFFPLALLVNYKYIWQSKSIFYLFFILSLFAFI